MAIFHSKQTVYQRVLLPLNWIYRCFPIPPQRNPSKLPLKPMFGRPPSCWPNASTILAPPPQRSGRLHQSLPGAGGASKIIWIYIYNMDLNRWMDIYIWIIWIYMASLTDWCMRIAKNQHKSSGILQINSVQLPAAEQKTEKNKLFPWWSYSVCRENGDDYMTLCKSQQSKSKIFKALADEIVQDKTRRSC